MEMKTLLYALLCVLLSAVCFFALRKKKSAKPRRAALLAAAILLLLAALFFAWLSVYYHAEPSAEKYLVSTDAVSVERRADGWRFDGPGEDTALIFYPGAKVEAAAYAPLLFRLAEGGLDAFLVEMPFNIAFFDRNAADRLIEAYAYRDWLLAGHSLGGAAASAYAKTYAEKLRGLVLLAAYPTGKTDEDLPFLSVYGDRDGVLNLPRYEKSRALWPKNAQELVIAGGNHAQFGSYGRQDGDGEAAISPEEQQKRTVDAILQWMAAQADSAPAALPEAWALRVAVASDLHLDPDNTNKNAAAMSAAGYNMELVDALLWDAREQGADFILLTGDLVNGGKPHRHAALAEKLRQAEAAGLPVYVLPGNHDLAPVGQQEFAEYYADFGFDEAYSRDLASLSYCVLREDAVLLMMDMGGYSLGAIDLPGAGKRQNNEAFLSEETLRWAETMLREARERELPVLCAGHFNLLTQESRNPEASGYHVENGERFAALLRKYGVPLFLSGHTHVRAVYREEGLTEQVTEYLPSYPTGYSMLDIEGGRLRCLPRRVDVSAWAEKSGQRDPALLDYAAWQQEQLRSYSEENVKYMAQRNPIGKKEQEQATAFFYAVMDAFWRGELYERREEMKAMPGCEPFFRCAEGYAYGWWLRDLLDTVSPLLKGYTLDMKQLYPDTNTPYPVFPVRGIVLLY